MITNRTSNYYFNLTEEYELYQYYLQFMHRLDISIHNEELIHDEGMVMKLSISYYDKNFWIEYDLFKDDIDDGFEALVVAEPTKSQLKEFLLQLYYNDKVINL
jgi:hypothetical protein